MEIADVFVVNKADRDGVDRVVAEIEAMLSLATHEGHRPEIVRTVAPQGSGIAELLAAVERFRSAAESSGLLARKRRERLRRQFEDAVQEEMRRRVRSRGLTDEETERVVDRLVAREIDPFSAAADVLERMGV
jgi:LAO/AO transport system kinase